MSIEDRKINENHRRAISVALTGLDEVLCSIESWADGREARGLLYAETNDLLPGQRQALRKRVHEVRELLAETCERLGLKGTEVRASRDIWSRCSVLRDTLSELDAKHMEGYGPLSPGLSRYMDHLSARLVAEIDRLLEEVRNER